MPFDDAGLSRLEVLVGSEVYRRGSPLRGNLPFSSLPHRLLPGAIRGWPDPVEEALTLDETSSQALDRIVELERLKARIDGELLDTYAWLHTVMAQQYERIASSNAFGTKVPAGLDQIVVKEITAATGLGPTEVTRRLSLATHPRRHRVLLDKLRQGLVGLGRALQLFEAEVCLDDEAVPAVEEKVLAPPRGSQAASETSPEATSEEDPVPAAVISPVSAATFRQRLHRALLAADPDGADERRRRSIRDRTAYGRITDEGTAVMTVTGTIERIVASLDRADGAARAARSAGDSRNLEQLRSDFITDAVLNWWPTAPDEFEAATGDGPVTGSGDVTHAVTSPRHPDEAAGAWVGRPVPARVWIVVPFEVAAGVSNAPCEVPGHGWVTAGHAREIISAPGSVWHNLPVDIDTGRALDRPSAAYTPSRSLAAFVRARDGICRGPGCTVLADRCDIDHQVPWPDGPTDERNLYSVSRGCHNPKTAELWVSEATPDGGLTWTTLAGREYVTYPKNWREALDEDADSAADSAQQEEPPPPF